MTILAKKVDIVEARETSRTDTEQKQRTGGLTIAITAPIVSAVQSLGGTARAVADTGSQRMKALGAASMALEAKGVADAVMQSPSQAMGVNLRADIGGNLNIESLQDRAKSDSRGSTARLKASSEMR